jgi:hypothetical protein
MTGPERCPRTYCVARPSIGYGRRERPEVAYPSIFLDYPTPTPLGSR